MSKDRFCAYVVIISIISEINTTGNEAYTITTVGYGISNVSINLAACRTHEGGGGGWVGVGTNKCAQKKCPPPCPAWGPNTAPWDHHSHAPTTELDR